MNARRAEICRTAAQMIHERGFDATSVSDIAHALGMTKAGLYHYISGKEALLLEIMDFGMDQLSAEVATPARRVREPEARLRELVTRHARLVMRSRGAVTQLVDEVRGLPMAGRRRIQRRMRAYFELVRDTLVELQREGRLRAIDPTVATFSVLAMILGLPRWFKPGGRLSADEVASNIATITLGAVLAPEPRATRGGVAASRGRRTPAPRRRARAAK